MDTTAIKSPKMPDRVSRRTRIARAARALAAAVVCIAAVRLAAASDGSPASGHVTGWTVQLVIEALVAVAALVAIAALSVAEVVLVSASRPLVRRLADSGNPRARRFVRTVDAAGDSAITGVVVSTNLATLVVAALVGHLTVRLLGERAYLWTALGTLAFILVVCEIIPKTYASHHADRLALSASGWLEAIIRSYPVRFLVAIVSAGAWPLRKALRVETLHRPTIITDEELLSLADVAAEEEVLDSDEVHMFESIVGFRGRTVREIMVPRVDMVTIRGDASVEDAVALIAEHGKSRVVVYGDTPDEVVGVLYANDLLACYHASDTNRRARDLAREAFMVPDTKRVDELFRELRRKQTHLALVIDEHGGVDGLVTMEDVLEEVIGDVRDEHDTREQQAIAACEDGLFLMSGGAPRLDVEEVLGIQLGGEEDDFDTLAGFLFLRCGTLPKPGFSVEHGGYRFEVTAMAGPRITKVRVERLGRGDA